MDEIQLPEQTTRTVTGKFLVEKLPTGILPVGKLSTSENWQWENLHCGNILINKQPGGKSPGKIEINPWEVGVCTPDFTTWLLGGGGGGDLDHKC